MTDAGGVVALLFTDLVGSTELLDRLGDDAAEALRRTHFRLLREATAAYGGEEVKSLGDGLMVVFPVASDAVACAVAMQRAVFRHNRQASLAGSSSSLLSVRIGLHVGEPIRDEDDYFGTAVVVAKRLCDRAEGGQILASELVRELCGSRLPYPATTCGDLTLKGLNQPIPAWEVDWTEPAPETAPLPGPLAAGDSSLFVGRQFEGARLSQIWKEAVDGSRRGVLVAGEPGIGKTRLAAHLARQVHEDGGLVLYGRCDAELAISYQPFIEALTSFVRTHPPEEVAARVGSGGVYLARLVPELMPDGMAASPTQTTGSEPEVERYLVLEAAVRFFAELSVDRPLLLVLDDLHWATKPTVLLLRHLLRSPMRMQLLVLGIYRDTELSPRHPLAEAFADLRRQGGVDRLVLRGLDEPAVLSYLEASAGHELDDRGQTFARVIAKETRGNPFFVGEVLAHLVESGAIYQEDGRWTADPDMTIERLGLPQGVREVVGRRVAQLSETSRQALTVAAVVGQRFSAHLLERLPLAEGNPDRLLAALEEASAAGLLIENDAGAYEFAHSLIRQTLVEELSTVRRVRLHRTIGEALEDLPPPLADPDLLAYHFAEAAIDGQAAKAAAYALDAAEHARARLAYEQAVSHIERGLEALELDRAADPAQRCDLLIALADVRDHLDDDEGAKQAAFLAADAARAAGSDERLVRAATVRREWGIHIGAVEPETLQLYEEALALCPPESPQRAHVLGMLGFYRFSVGEPDYRATVDLVKESVELARRTGDEPTLLAALVDHCYVMTATARAGEQLSILDEAMRLSERTGDMRRRAYALLLRARAALELGDLVMARADTAALQQLGSRSRLGLALGFAARLRATLAAIDGRFDDVEPLAEEQLRQREDPNFANIYAALLLNLHMEQGRLEEFLPLVQGAVDTTPGIVAFRGALALILAELGRLDEARVQLDIVAADDFKALVRDTAWTAALAVLSQTAARVGDATAAQKLHELFLPHRGHLVVTSVGIGGCQGAVDRYLAMTAQACGRADGADALYASALELEQRIGAKPFIARTSLWYGRMLQEAGAVPRAKPLITAAHRIATDLGMAGVAEESTALL